MPVVSPAFLAAIDQVRSIRQPSVFNVVPSQLTIQRRVWPGGKLGALGAASAPTVTTIVTVPQYYPFKLVQPKEIAGSGGRYERAKLKVGPITPAFPAGPWGPAGGFTQAQLVPSAASSAEEIIYLVTGNHAGEYDLVDLTDDKATAWTLTIVRRRTTP